MLDRPLFFYLLFLRRRNNRSRLIKKKIWGSKQPVKYIKFEGLRPVVSSVNIYSLREYGALRGGEGAEFNYITHLIKLTLLCLMIDDTFIKLLLANINNFK
jgi:hypothetical protein